MQAAAVLCCLWRCPRNGCEGSLGEFETLGEALAFSKQVVDPLDLIGPGEWWDRKPLDPEAFMDHFRLSRLSSPPHPKFAEH